MTTIGAAVVAAAALPGAAMAAECAPQPTAPVFAAFGDTNQYFLAEGGDFESLGGWRLRGTPELVRELNPLGLTLGTSSLDLDSGDGVTTAPFCVDRTMPHLRFTAKAAGSGQLDVVVTTHYKGSSDSSSGSVSSSDHRSFRPGRTVELKTSSIPAGEQAVATVTFRSQGDWQVDDVFIDPYRR